MQRHKQVLRQPGTPPSSTPDFRAPLGGRPLQGGRENLIEIEVGGIPAWIISPCHFDSGRLRQEGRAILVHACILLAEHSWEHPGDLGSQRNSMPLSHLIHRNYTLYTQIKIHPARVWPQIISSPALLDISPGLGRAARPPVVLFEQGSMHPSPAQC